MSNIIDKDYVNVLHIMPHLGGGVGKALSTLCKAFIGTNFLHSFIILETPKKKQFLDKIIELKCDVHVKPDAGIAYQLIKNADIVQLEWWNHPAVFKFLCEPVLPEMRLLIWCHVSGFHTPIIPKQLILASHIFLFTSQCSFKGKEVMSLIPEFGDRLGVVSSSGGFSGLPESRAKANESIAVGYIGSLNFAKLHPRYVDYLAAVEIPGFRVRMIGDVTNQDILNQQCDRSGKTGMLEFRGYSTDVASELATINVIAYLLNPEHYGTTENALLEAMAMGIVPIVLDNPAERQIVDDRNTGLIVRSPVEFAEAVKWLSNNPDDRQRLGSQAAKSVRERFSVEKVEASLNLHYQEILSMEKRKIVFSEIFGTNPAEWFLSCQGDRNIFTEDGSINSSGCVSGGYGLFEKSKGTAFHFSEYFPDNLKLKLWAKNLKSLQ